MLNYDVEEAVLSIIFHDDKHDFSSPEDIEIDMFTTTMNRSICNKLKTCFNEKRHPDFFTGISMGFTPDEMKTMMSVMDYIKTWSSYKRYLLDLIEKKKRRELSELTQEENFGFDKAAEILHETNQSNIEVHSVNNMTEYLDYKDETILGKFKKFDLGFKGITSEIGTLREGQLLVVGARTSMGKSSLLIKLAYNLAKNGEKVLYLSSEMQNEHILDRMIGIVGQINTYRIFNPEKLTPEERKTFNETASKINKLKIDIAEISRFKLNDIRKIMIKGKYNVVLVDYIQCFAVSGNKTDTRASIFSEIANTLKAMSMEFNCLVIAASQISRDVDKQEKQNLSLSMLKESGGIEEASDLVLLIEKVSDLDISIEVNFKIAKNRYGKTCSIPMFFIKEYCDFIEKGV